MLRADRSEQMKTSVADTSKAPYSPSGSRKQFVCGGGGRGWPRHRLLPLPQPPPSADLAVHGLGAERRCDEEHLLAGRQQGLQGSGGSGWKSGSTDAHCPPHLPTCSGASFSACRWSAGTRVSRSLMSVYSCGATPSPDALSWSAHAWPSVTE